MLRNLGKGFIIILPVPVNRITSFLRNIPKNAVKYNKTMTYHLISCFTKTGRSRFRMIMNKCMYDVNDVLRCSPLLYIMLFKCVMFLKINLLFP